MITKEAVQVITKYKYKVTFTREFLEPLVSGFSDLDLGNVNFESKELNFFREFFSDDDYTRFVSYLIGVYEGWWSFINTLDQNSYAYTSNKDGCSYRYITINSVKVEYKLSLSSIELEIESEKDVDNSWITEEKEEPITKCNTKEDVIKELYPIFKDLLILNKGAYPRYKASYEFKHLVDDESLGDSYNYGYSYKGFQIDDMIIEKLITKFNEDPTHEYKYYNRGSCYYVVKRY